jgi:hypothetical protein
LFVVPTRFEYSKELNTITCAMFWCKFFLFSRTLDFLHEDIQLAYRMLVVLLGCLFVTEKVHKEAPEVFLHQLSWKVAP